jgi:DNA polymerase-3 subunit gamma/tau
MVDSDRHIELYKKYRPRRWDELIGQQSVARTLQSAVIHQKIPTAYGFFGARGTGKTSSAFLLAKSINCLNPQKDGNPCNECEICKAIDNRSQLGVNYISMANNGSVEDIRQIVKDAYLNQNVKRQVFILDEIHTIHKTAFDALLIPIEDEKMPALFILCSTEINKIPETILSRIQSRRFDLVDHDIMKTYIENISKKENLGVSDDQIESVVRAGRGSVRDTLSRLEAVSETGEASPTFGGKLLEAVVSKKISEALKVVAEASDSKVFIPDLTEQLFEDLRNLLLSSAGVDDDIIGVIPLDDVKSAIRSLYGQRGITIALDEIGSAINLMTQGSDHRIELEIALVKTFEKFRKLQKVLEAKKARGE